MTVTSPQIPVASFRSDRREFLLAGMGLAVAGSGVSASAGLSRAAADVAGLDRPAPARCCGVIELRQYTLHPGQRDTLIALFERHFVETQEAEGMRLIGQFRDLDRPDRFVWLRGFADMPSRARALNAFYSGPTWKAHRSAANATMIDSDNVLLLKPADSGSGFQESGRSRLPPDAGTSPPGLVVATIAYLDAAPDEAFKTLLAQSVLPELERQGACVVARLVTEASENTFPALPVRAGEWVFVWFATYDSMVDYETHLARLEGSARWQREILPDLRRRLRADLEVLRLVPTTRSLLHG
ncbi:NIPSNAP family protein [Tahibacter amnicola]|uniref:NIPSNAP family protein n=1 Tax=Tahibacter amnicola TaxID=2976241 RepID=A0ABY6B899_9GAMM|nr:NIPSNAP family protein [Tahibacter amnicola]UXI66244.1 NIPSNAP family protein [Tahibacter amnicola]